MKHDCVAALAVPCAGQNLISSCHTQKIKAVWGSFGPLAGITHFLSNHHSSDLTASEFQMVVVVMTRLYEQVRAFTFTVTNTHSCPQTLPHESRCLCLQFQDVTPLQIAGSKSMAFYALSRYKDLDITPGQAGLHFLWLKVKPGAKVEMKFIEGFDAAGLPSLVALKDQPAVTSVAADRLNEQIEATLLEAEKRGLITLRKEAANAAQLSRFVASLEVDGKRPREDSTAEELAARAAAAVAGWYWCSQSGWSSQLAEWSTTKNVNRKTCAGNIYGLASLHRLVGSTAGGRSEQITWKFEQHQVDRAIHRSATMYTVYLGPDFVSKMELKIGDTLGLRLSSADPLEVTISISR